MKFLQYAKVVFIILSCVVLSFILPIGFAFFYGETRLIGSFVIPMLPVLIITAVLFFVTRGSEFRLSTRGGISLVALSWVCAAIIGAMPFLLSGSVKNFADALFESASGFTTTGATIMETIEDKPISILVWRAETHWLGGMGIVVLAVALFPLLGVGGFRLIKSEMPGPDKGKLTSKVTETAKALWFIYCGLTIAEVIALMCAGMNFTDALCHAFSTLGTGGFSTKNSSISSYNSTAINIICTIFMVLAAINFSVYMRLFQGYPKDFFKNSEFKAFLRIFFGISISIGILLVPYYHSISKAFEHGFFQVASVISTTGFTSTDFSGWPEPAKILLLLVFFIGGSSGSTAGGIKVIRWVILKKQAGNEMKRLLYPHGVFSIQLDGRPGRKDIVYSVAGFLFLYFLLVSITAIIAVFAGANILSGLVTGLTLLGNIGIGFDMIGPDRNFQFFADWSKYIFSFMMIAGRLELYTMLLFFHKSFYRK